MPQTTLRRSADVTYRVGDTDEVLTKSQILTDPRDLVVVSAPTTSVHWGTDRREHRLRVLPREDCHVVSGALAPGRANDVGGAYLYQPKQQMRQCADCGTQVSAHVRQCDRCYQEAQRWLYTRRRLAPPLDLTDEVGADDKLTFGIEIEVDARRSFDSRRFHDIFPHWESTTDGSIDSEDHPIELIGGPFQCTDRQDLIDMISGLHSGKFGDFRVNRSCGLHVHVGNIAGRNDLDHSSTALAGQTKKIQRIVRMWQALQRDLYRAIPASRRDSSYCKPYEHDDFGQMLSADNVYQLGAAVYRPGISEYETDGYDWAANGIGRYDDARYFGLNLHSWFYRGTLEFRLAPGTLNAAKITHWLDLYLAIVREGRRYPAIPLPRSLAEFAGEYISEDAANHWTRRIARYS